MFQKSSDYYIQKGNGDVIKINKLFAKLIVLEYIEDNPTQYQQIKSIGELTSQNLILIISDYNKWVQANNVVDKDTAFRQGTAQTINDSGIIGADIKNQSENSKEALLHQHRFTARINLLGAGMSTKLKNNLSTLDYLLRLNFGFTI